MPLNNPITSALLADPEIFQQNRLPFHAHFADQTSPEMPLAVSLDGEWAFHYAENLTAPFSDWDTLTVPGFIQMQSLQKPGQPYGTPHYVNTQYPWDGHEKLHPDQIPQDYNPIGEYQRSFTLPESWASCYLRLNGADSAAAVWCNDVYIGCTEDTSTPTEFDMTAAVHPGENTLTVQVYRFSSGSWLEDQDFWRMSGLFRSVELFTKPEIHLEDVFVKQDFAPDFSSATVTFDCKVSGAGTISVVFDGEEQSAEVGEPAEYDSGVVFGKGEADIMVALEKMEAVRYAEFLNPNGVAVINDYAIKSTTIASGAEAYPEGCIEAMQKNFKTIAVPASDIAIELGNPKCMNVVLFGAMCDSLGCPEIDWEQVVAETVPAKVKELNLKAFRAGREAAKAAK